MHSALPRLTQIVRDGLDWARAETSSPNKRRECRKLRRPGRIAGYETLWAPPKDPQDQSKAIDVASEERLLGALKQAFGDEGFVVLSEESGVLLSRGAGGEDPLGGAQLRIALLDPIDSTDLAVVGLGGAVSAGALIATLESRRITELEWEAVVIGDLARGEVFWSAGLRGPCGVDTPAGAVETLQRDADATVADMILSSVNAKRPRLDRFAHDAPRWLGDLDGASARVLLHHGGPLPIVKVAAGDIDCVVERDKGYKCIDWLGLVVAQAAGCSLQLYERASNHSDARPWSPTSLTRVPAADGLEAQLQRLLTERCAFYCAANETLGAWCERTFFP